MAAGVPHRWHQRATDVMIAGARWRWLQAMAAWAGLCPGLEDWGARVIIHGDWPHPTHFQAAMEGMMGGVGRQLLGPEEAWPPG